MKYVVSALLSLAASSVHAQGNVVVLGPPGPGVDTSSPQTAIDMASDGDTVLVLANTYAKGFEISGKSLTVVGDSAGAPPLFQDECTVSHLAADQRVVLQGLRIEFSYANGTPLTISDNDGHVWVEDVSAKNDDGSFWVTAGVRVTNSQSVTLVRADVAGGTSGVDPAFGSAGLACLSSTVSVYDSVIVGKAGSDFACVVGFCSGLAPSGVAGAVVEGSFLFASGSHLQGGAGGNVVGDCCGGACLPLPGAGGDALAFGSGADVWLLDTVLTPGVGGLAGPAACPPGADGVATAGGVPTVLGAPSLALTASSPVRELQTLQLQLAGPAGSPVLVAFALDSADVFLPSLSGTLLVGGPGSLFVAGSLPPSGVLDLSLAVPILAVGLQSSLVFGQSAYLDPTGAAVLGAAAAVVVLDQAL